MKRSVEKVKKVRKRNKRNWRCGRHGRNHRALSLSHLVADMDTTVAAGVTLPTPYI